MLELIHTSAEKGLKDGTSGFCSVAWTEGMPISFIPILEQMSGYKVLYAPKDPAAINNPIAYIFTRRSIGGRSQAIISRLCANGIDYTGRANKIAHHIVLTSEEETMASPLDYCRAKENFYTSWSNEPQILSYRRPTISQECIHSKSWESYTGDKNWASAIANIFLRTPDQSITVVTRPELDVLPLIDEVMRKLPREKSWQFTFNTYFIGLTPGSSCFLRFCLEDSDALKMAQRRAGSIIINLINPSQNKPAPALAKELTQPTLTLMHIEDTILNPIQEEVTKEKRKLSVKYEPNYNESQIKNFNESDTLEKNWNPLKTVIIIAILILLSIFAYAYFSQDIPPPPIAKEIPIPIEEVFINEHESSSVLQDDNTESPIEPSIPIVENIVPVKKTPNAPDIQKVPEVKKEKVDPPKPLIEKIKPSADDHAKLAKTKEWWNKQISELKKKPLYQTQFDQWNNEKKITLILLPKAENRKDIIEYEYKNKPLTFKEIVIKNQSFGSNEKDYFKISPDSIIIYGVNESSLAGIKIYEPTKEPCAQIIIDEGEIKWMDLPFNTNKENKRVTQNMVQSITLNHYLIDFNDDIILPEEWLNPIKINTKNGVGLLTDSHKIKLLKDDRITAKTTNPLYYFIKNNTSKILLNKKDFDNCKLSSDLYNYDFRSRKVNNNNISIEKKHKLIILYHEWILKYFDAKKVEEDPILGPAFIVKLEELNKKAKIQELEKENKKKEIEDIENENKKLRNRLDLTLKKFRKMESENDLNINKGFIVKEYEKIKEIVRGKEGYFENKYIPLLDKEITIEFKQKFKRKKGQK